MTFQNDVSILGAVAGFILFTIPLLYLYTKYRKRYARGEISLSKRFTLIYGKTCLYTNCNAILCTIGVLAATGWSCLPGEMKVSSVKYGSSAYDAGIKPGDIILPQNISNLDTLDRAPLFVAESKGNELLVAVDIKRGNELVKGTLIKANESGPLNIQSLGIKFAAEWHPYQSIREFGSSVYLSSAQSFNYTKNYWTGELHQVSLGQIDVYENSHRFIFTLIVMSIAFTPIALLIVFLSFFCGMVSEVIQRTKPIVPVRVRG